jgi:hypothetical protein
MHDNRYHLRAPIAVMAALVLGAVAGTTEASAAGHWRFKQYVVTPPQSQLDAIKAMPGRVQEEKVWGAFQPKSSGQGTVNSYFKTDDPDRKVYITTHQCNFHANADMLALTPGQIVHFTGDGSMTANAGTPSGSCKMAEGNGDYFMAFDFNHMKKGSGSGDWKVPGGGPNSTLDLYIKGYQANLGALGGQIDIYYDWVPN